MEVEILTTEEAILAEQADAVFLPAFSGEMEVLDGHAPCIVILKKGIVLIRKDGKKKYFGIEKGYAEITPQKTLILLQS